VIPMFYELLLRMAETHSKMNHDYAEQKNPLSNLQACVELDVSPYKGVLIRLQDKWSRIVQLSKKEAQVTDETVEDTHLDSAVYHLLAIIVRRKAGVKHV
jgi:hypothetical protein